MQEADWKLSLLSYRKERGRQTYNRRVGSLKDFMLFFWGVSDFSFHSCDKLKHFIYCFYSEKRNQNPAKRRNSDIWGAKSPDAKKTELKMAFLTCFNLGFWNCEAHLYKPAEERVWRGSRVALRYIKFALRASTHIMSLWIKIAG